MTQALLTRSDLLSLEEYAEKRAAFKTQVLEHKKSRQLAIGANAVLYFEDRLTIQYQIQEMLRIEKIFEADGINEELGAYNPLIPTGSNWKATFMLEYTDPEVRAKALAKLVGIEDTVWLRIEGHDKVFAIANEDMERSTDEKTSAVHFMRFELTDAMKNDALAGKNIFAGIDHLAYQQETAEVNAATRQSLIADLK
ncbi:MAG: DUF3501 family protein [Gammaproteobacteria bacterium]|nr:DUF3501 family protein [Gammaproteobacteria bacterium]